MMNDDIPEVFRQMDAMMARLMSGMEAVSPGLPYGTMGYRIVIHGGNLPGDRSGPGDMQPRNSQEPVAEVHRIGNEVKVIVELPGITGESIRLGVQGESLVIDAGDADRHYRTSALLPAVDPASEQRSFKNGVLEVTFTVLPDTPAMKSDPEK